MSNETFEIDVMELLCSRLCHELISPVSAINNGIELMADETGDGLAERTNLMGYSAVQASERLQFYRMAYGRGGGEGRRANPWVPVSPATSPATLPCPAPSPLAMSGP